MCGIAGIVALKRTPQELNKLTTKMLKIIKNRGPDDEGLFTSDGISLAHTRLSIISPETGKQPLVSQDKRYVISYNGEIYNYKELRSSLKNRWIFKTESDTEVVLAAYATWGRDCLKKLNGMFAFFIWDSQLKIGFAARDLLGIKPFYYCILNQNELVFASDINAILEIIPTKMNHDFIWNYWICPPFAFNDETPFEMIKALPGGYYIELSVTKIDIICWKNYQFDIRQVRYTPYGTKRLKSLVTKACERATISDFPLTTYLSGGLDSSIITSLVADYVCDFKESYNIVFEQPFGQREDQNSIIKTEDNSYAKIVAESLGINLIDVYVTDDELVNAIPTIACINPMIPTWEQELTHYFLAKEISLKYKVALVGDVADETHYGYHYFLNDTSGSFADNFLRIINFFQNAQLSISKECHEYKLNALKQKFTIILESAGFDLNNSEELTYALSFLVIKNWLPRLLLETDLYPMHFGLEARVPFADLKLIDFVRKIDASIANDKKLLRLAFKGCIPEKIRNREKSSCPTSQSISTLYQKELKNILKLNDSKDILGKYLCLNYINVLVNKTTMLSTTERHYLFKIISYFHWYKCYFS